MVGIAKNLYSLMFNRMACLTKGNYIKSILLRISFPMMIVNGLSRAFVAFEVIDFRDFPKSSGVINTFPSFFYHRVKNVMSPFPFKGRFFILFPPIFFIPKMIFSHAFPLIGRTSKFSKVTTRFRFNILLFLRNSSFDSLRIFFLRSFFGKLSRFCFNPICVILLFAFLSFFSFHNASAVEQSIGPFLGINNTDNPAVIPASNAQDLLNVDLSLGGKSIFKRSGYGLAYALTIATSPVHGVYDFYDSAGNEISLAFNDAYLTSSISGASPTVIFSTGPNGATYQCVDSQGFAYCSNTSRTAVIKTNGITSGTAPLVVVTTGTMVAVTPDRLVQAGFASFPNRIDFSAANDFTSWVTGIANTSAFQFTITAPGARITHITYAFNRTMWFKESSFGYILPGATPIDWVVKTISPNLGSLDNTSVYYQGILYFRGNDGHIWAYDGANLTKLTRDIGGTINASQGRTINSWTQSSATDWNSSSFTPTTLIDTTSTLGNIQFRWPDNFDAFRNGLGGTENIWKSYAPPTSNTSTNAVVASGNLVIMSSNAAENYVRMVTPLPDYKGGTTFYILISSMTPHPLTGRSLFTFYLSTMTNDAVQASILNNLQVVFESTTSSRIFVRTIATTIDGTICTGSCQSGFSAIPATIQIFLSTTTYRVTINDTSIKDGTMGYFNRPTYTHFGRYYSDVAPSKLGSVYIDAFGVAPETTTFYSQVKNASGLTAWDSFSATKLDSGGSQNFFIRSATNSFTILSTTPTWTSILSGAIPSVSTGTYFQFKDDLSLLISSSSSLNLQDFTQSWFEGSASDKSYSTYFSDSIWFSVTAGTGATTNNRILKFDLINNTWLLYDLAANGFYIRQNDLYFGSALTGNVFKFGSASSDNGSAINSYWKSKDFFMTSPFTDDDVTSLSVYFASVNNSTATVTYTINGSSSTSYLVPLQRTASFGRFNRNLVQGAQGNTFNFQFGNNAADQNWELFAIGYNIIPDPWNPGQ